jgi:hypothetical protein
MKRLAIIGSRDYPLPHLIERIVATLRPDTVVVSGGARGVGSWAIGAATARGLATEVMPADWDGLGKRAGIASNVELIDSVDGCIAFWDGKSRGTKHAIGCAMKRRIWTRIYDAEGRARTFFRV